jgi:predicted ATPase
LDDLHWVDEGTIGPALPAPPAAGGPGSPPGTHREVELDRSPWREPSWTGIAISPAFAQRLTLEETGALLTTLLDQADIPPDQLAAVYGETEGNAFFVEEVVKSLIEQGRIGHGD